MVGQLGEMQGDNWATLGWFGWKLETNENTDIIRYPAMYYKYSLEISEPSLPGIC
jgi:hypothetical protein